MSPFKVVYATPGDLPQIFQWFDESINYQRKKGYPTWENYDQGAIARDIDNGNFYKVINDAGTGIVFAVGYNDKVIWRHHDAGESMYLHRIVVNPAFKGQKLFGEILNWAREHLKERGLKNIRMDTWAANPAIINYYKTFGFAVIENYTPPDVKELPVHNRNLALTLLEYRGR